METLEYTVEMPATTGHYVYRTWADNGSSLYVGAIGLGRPRLPAERFREHAADHYWWWPDVARIDFAICETPDQARVEEDRQIKLLSPMHNKMGRVVTESHARERARQTRELLALKRRKRDLLAELETVDTAISALKCKLI